MGARRVRKVGEAPVPWRGTARPAGARLALRAATYAVVQSDWNGRGRWARAMSSRGGLSRWPWVARFAHALATPPP